MREDSPNFVLPEGRPDPPVQTPHEEILDALARLSEVLRRLYDLDNRITPPDDPATVTPTTASHRGTALMHVLHDTPSIIRNFVEDAETTIRAIEASLFT